MSDKLTPAPPVPLIDSEATGSEEARPYLSRTGYQRMRRTVVLATAAVSIIPLVIMTVLNYDQYERSMHSETVQSVSRMVSTNKRALEFFLLERRSALSYIVLDRRFEELCDAAALGRIMRNMNEAFAAGAFVDLGIIDAAGTQLCYAGPFDLQGKSYAEQDWFLRVSRRGVFISDVFLGFRKSPHFAIATRHEWENHGHYVLRTTVDAEMLSDQISTTGLSPYDDLFLINQEGVLQTPSRRYGAVLGRIPIAVPHRTTEPEVVEARDEKGAPIYLGYAQIADSPFVLMHVKMARPPTSGWLSFPARLIAFLILSAALTLGVILWGARQFIENLRAGNIRRAALMHKVEYNNKLASIGRLASGVAHEINNPLAIINEKAGLLKDIVGLDPAFPKREKLLGIVDSVLASVERCKKITHRLLGFAKHMDVQAEALDITTLLHEVVGFLGKEAEYRNIRISVDSAPGVPNIESDRGQLQQVFLNLLNNAVAAVKDGGRVEIAISLIAGRGVSVSISDDGIGIPRENLQRIFEPFFTTKEGSGTGLGLSITYGIVQKLGGEISVESRVNVGTRFTVILPLRRKG